MLRVIFSLSVFVFFSVFLFPFWASSVFYNKVEVEVIIVIMPSFKTVADISNTLSLYSDRYRHVFLSSFRLVID